MRLPGFGSDLGRWLLQPIRPSTWRILVVGVALLLWGTRLPGWNRITTQLGLVICACCGVGWCIGALTRLFAARIGAMSPYDAASTIRNRRFARMLLFAITVAALRPTMYLSFWIALPGLNRLATQIQSANYSEPLQIQSQWIGTYQIWNIRRCPHGLKVSVDYWDELGKQFGDLYFWTDRGFVYKVEPGECSRFDAGPPLAKNWHAEGDWLR